MSLTDLPQRRDRWLIGLSLAAIVSLAWLFLFQLAADMSAMEGLGGRMMGMGGSDSVARFLAVALSPNAAAHADSTVNFALLALMWAVMMVAMMLPSAMPTILLFAALERKRGSLRSLLGRNTFFLLGYVAMWGGFSVVAAGLQTYLGRLDLLSMDMTLTSHAVAGGIFAIVAFYEISPLKERCLVFCQNALQWLPAHYKPGLLGALRMGLAHGAFCVGCCWALMLLLFVVGVMNLAWVATIALVVLMQKFVAGGRVVRLLSSGALLAVGAVLSLWNGPI